MKIKHICTFAASINSCLDELDYCLLSGNAIPDLSGDKYLQLLNDCRNEIWENSQSLDELFLQYSYFVKHFVSIKQKITRCRNSIFTLRSNLDNMKNPDALFSYNNELAFLSCIEDELRFILAEMKGTLNISLSHRQRIEQNQMVTTLKDLFKVEEDYERVMKYLIIKGKINAQNCWIDKRKGYKLELICVFYLLFEKGFLKTKKYDASFMQQVIFNTYNIDISTKTILSKVLKNQYGFADFPSPIMNGDSKKPASIKPLFVSLKKR